MGPAAHLIEGNDLGHAFRSARFLVLMVTILSCEMAGRHMSGGNFS